ncbi:MAG: DUF1559 family PulG-like putative transporter [Planctomycetota bacterium]|jgi:hypothetical protein
MAGKSRLRRFFGYVVVLAVLGVLLVGGFLLFRRSARRAVWRATRANYLKQIGVGFHNFENANKHFPPAVRRDESGRPLCSWRLQLLPFMEAIMIGIHYGKPWDDPVNRKVTGQLASVFCFAADEDSPDRFHTNFVAITGPGTPLDEDQGCRIKNLDMSDTILVIEIVESNTHWAAAGDLHIDRIPESITAGPDGGGVHVLFANGEVWFLRREVPLADLKKFFTIEGAKRYDREMLLAPYAERR